MINNLDLKTTKHLSTSLVHSNKNKNPDNQTTNRVNLYSERDLNPHNRYGHKILSLACLPFHHPSSL